MSAFMPPLQSVAARDKLASELLNLDGSWRYVISKLKEAQSRVDQAPLHELRAEATKLQKAVSSCLEVLNDRIVESYRRDIALLSLIEGLEQRLRMRDGK